MIVHVQLFTEGLMSNFYMNTNMPPYFVQAGSEGSGRTTWMHDLPELSLATDTTVLKWQGRLSVKVLKFQILFSLCFPIKYWL